MIYLAATEGFTRLEVNGSHTNYSTLIKPPLGVCRFDLLYSEDELMYTGIFSRSLSMYVQTGALRVCIYNNSLVSLSTTVFKSVLFDSSFSIEWELILVQLS